jgi:hypothetical protein
MHDILACLGADLLGLLSYQHSQLYKIRYRQIAQPQHLWYIFIVTQYLV